MISSDPSRMYAALRCIEAELENKKPSIKVIRKIIAEAGRELRPTKRAGGRAYAAPCGCVEGKVICLRHACHA